MRKRRWLKICFISVGILLILCVVFLIAALTLFDTQIRAARSIRKIDEGFYILTYEGDYGFDRFLEQGGAASDELMGNYIASFLSHGFWKPEMELESPDFGCSTLSVQGPEGENLLGRNYDWENCDAMIVHTIPDNGYESVSACCLDFLGFGEGWKPEGIGNQFMALAAVYVPLDGINEKGLCIADLLAGDDREIRQDTEKPDLTVVSGLRLILDKAATVEEAVALLQQYDMNSSIGTAHHFAISDASGRSAVVEYVNNEMVVTETSVVTNHYLSPGEMPGPDNEESVSRFHRLAAMEQDAEGIMTREQLRDCMEAVSYEGTTQWSIVFDSQNLTADYYWQRKYDQPCRIRLEGDSDRYE